MNNIKLNSNRGVYVFSESNGNSIIRNNIEENGADGTPDQSGVIFIDRSSDNKIHYNNFLSNSKGYYFILCSSNNWKGNYWDKSRFFPKLIIGQKIGILLWIPCFNIDWQPAKEPYDI